MHATKCVQIELDFSSEQSEELAKKNFCDILKELNINEEKDLINISFFLTNKSDCANNLIVFYCFEESKIPILEVFLFEINLLLF